MTITYSVPAVTCSHCEWAITRKVAAVAGVSGCSVDLATKTVTVHGTFDDAAIRSAIDDAGYDVA